jgi:hypothetical protein
MSAIGVKPTSRGAPECHPLTQSGHFGQSRRFLRKEYFVRSASFDTVPIGGGMKNHDLFAAAFALLAIGSGMAFYEWKRIGAGRPIMGKSQAVVLYWCGYLTFLVMGVTTALAAIVR